MQNSTTDVLIMSEETPLQFQVQLLKHNCAVGIFHLEAGKFLYCHGVQKFFGYSDAEFSATSFRVNIHPEDMETAGTINSLCEKFAMEVPGAANCRLSLIYRAEKKDYGYIRVLQQTCPYECDVTGKVISCLVAFSDVSFAHGMNAVTWNFEGPAEIQEKFNRILQRDASPIFSDREMEILRLLNQGMQSDEIARKLFISRHTADTHRRRMLKKVNRTNTLAMLQHCRKIGLLQ